MVNYYKDSTKAVLAVKLSQPLSMSFLVINFIVYGNVNTAAELNDHFMAITFIMA